MDVATPQLEVWLRLARPVQLGPDAGVVGRQPLGLDARPEAADVTSEFVTLGRIDRIVLGLDIDQVGTEHPLPAQVAAIVGAQRPGDGRRIDQPLERRRSRQAEIDALAQVARGDVGRRIAVDAGGDGLGLKTGRGDQQARGQNRPTLSARRDAKAAVRQWFGPLERRGDHDRAARVLDLAL